MSEEKKGSHHQSEEPSPHYGTFQGVVNHPPPTAIGFPQPIPPPGASGSPPPPQYQYYGRDYQTVPGYAVAEGRPVRERRLPCCGCGLGWFLYELKPPNLSVPTFLGRTYVLYDIISLRFILGFLIVGIPWYVAAILLMCSRNIDPREKPGYVACTVAAVLAAIATIFGLTRVA